MTGSVSFWENLVTTDTTYEWPADRSVNLYVNMEGSRVLERKIQSKLSVLKYPQEAEVV